MRSSLNKEPCHDLVDGQLHIKILIIFILVRMIIKTDVSLIKCKLQHKNDIIMESEWWDKVREDVRAIQSVPDLHRTEALCIEAARLGALRCVPMAERTAAVCHTGVLHDPLSFYFVPCNMLTNELCMLAVSKWPSNIRYVPEHMRTDELCDLAISKVTSRTEPILPGLPDRYRNNLEVCWKLFELNHEEFGWFPDHLKTEAVCLAAIGVYPWALNCVPTRRITEEMCRKALSHPKCCWTVLQCVPEHLRSAEFCALAVQHDGQSLAEVPVPLRTKELCLAALKTGVRNKWSRRGWEHLVSSIPSDIREKEDIAKEIAHVLPQKTPAMVAAEKEAAALIDYPVPIMGE